MGSTHGAGLADRSSLRDYRYADAVSALTPVKRVCGRGLETLAGHGLAGPKGRRRGPQQQELLICAARQTSMLLACSPVFLGQTNLAAIVLSSNGSLASRIVARSSGRRLMTPFNCPPASKSLFDAARSNPNETAPASKFVSDCWCRLTSGDGCVNRQANVAALLRCAGSAIDNPT